MLKATVLTDNIESGELSGEWGLSIYIEYKNKKILLDAGASDLFTVNAEKLGVQLADIDFAVLSHAHYDHANGMPVFFERNQTAKFYLSCGCKENCYSMKNPQEKMYIGIPRDSLSNFNDRIIYTHGTTEIAEGVTLLAHTTPHLEEIGKREGMYVEENGQMIPDDFSHEQSLIFDTDKGLVIFNSCCHAGAYNIVREVSEAFPGKSIAALIGGFHLFTRTDDEVREFAAKVRDCKIPYICTGHCTGDKAYAILESELGEIVHKLHCGLIMQW